VIPFWAVSDALCDASQPYDVLFFPEGELRPDVLTADDLAQYRTVILPDCVALTPAQAQLLTDVLAAGKRLVVLDELGTNLPPETMQPILNHPGTLRLETGRPFTSDDLPLGPQARVTPSGDLMINVQRVDGGAAVHLIRYDFDEGSDHTPLLPELTIELFLLERFGALSLYSPGGEMSGTLDADGFWHRLHLRDVPLYGIALLEPACAGIATG
jgi:hypothetical protein